MPGRRRGGTRRRPKDLAGRHIEGILPYIVKYSKHARPNRRRRVPPRLRPGTHRPRRHAWRAAALLARHATAAFGGGGGGRGQLPTVPDRRHAATLAVLRKAIRPDALQRAWSRTIGDARTSLLPCPSCSTMMNRVPTEGPEIDLCRCCQLCGSMRAS